MRLCFVLPAAFHQAKASQFHLLMHAIWIINTNKLSGHDLFIALIFSSPKLFIFGCFPTKDMQTPPPLRSGHLFIKDGECAESNEESYFRFFRFLVFELLAAKELPSRKKHHKYTHID